MLLVAAALSLAGCSGSSPSPHRAPEAAPEVIRLGPGPPPGTESWSGPEQAADAELPNLGKVHVITNVTMPSVTVFRPPAGQSNGTAVLVVPGGAFRALAWDLDGTETAGWLTRRGVTAFVLEYRVRPPSPSTAPGVESFDDFAARTAGARQIAVADAAQAIRLIRANARRFGVAPNKVGMIGFSAGAMTTMLVALSPDASVRPDFAASLYGALLSAQAPRKDAPPVFIVAAQDDPQVPPGRSVEIFDRWTAAHRPAELHLYESGGHGFAFRPHHLPAASWPAAFQAWLASRGYVAPPAAAAG
jgi:acetyl esterase/lipase